MITVQGKQIETDAFGYLLNIADWNEDVAKHIALLEGVELTEAHWEVIYFVRDFYQEYNTSPAIRMLVKAISEKLGADKAIAAICNDSSLTDQLSKQPNWRVCQNQLNAYRIT